MARSKRPAAVAIAADSRAWSAQWGESFGEPGFHLWDVVCCLAAADGAVGGVPPRRALRVGERLGDLQETPRDEAPQHRLVVEAAGNHRNLHTKAVVLQLAREVRNNVDKELSAKPATI